MSAGSDALAQGAARLVGSILAYSRWPSSPSPVRLCVVGPADHAAALDGLLPGGIAVDRREVPSTSANLGSLCDALYIGNLSLPAMRQVTSTVRGRAVVTIAEDDPHCRSESMFCLVFAPRALSFQMNIDAIARSAVRIDPRVLRMARDY